VIMRGTPGVEYNPGGKIRSGGKSEGRRIGEKKKNRVAGKTRIDCIEAHGNCNKKGGFKWFEGNLLLCETVG